MEGKEGIYPTSFFTKYPYVMSKCELLIRTYLPRLKVRLYEGDLYVGSEGVQGVRVQLLTVLDELKVIPKLLLIELLQPGEDIVLPTDYHGWSRHVH